METVNLTLLVLIFIFSLANLIVEINDNIDKHYEIIFRVCFGGMAIGSVIMMFAPSKYWFFSLFILIVLVTRYIKQKR